MKSVLNWKKAFSMAAVIAMTCGAVACSSDKNDQASADDTNTPVVRSDSATGSQIVMPPPAGASSAGRAR